MRFWNGNHGKSQRLCTHYETIGEQVAALERLAANVPAALKVFDEFFDGDACLLKNAFQSAYG